MRAHPALHSQEWTHRMLHIHRNISMAVPQAMRPANPLSQNSNNMGKRHFYFLLLHLINLPLFSRQIAHTNDFNKSLIRNKKNEVINGKHYVSRLLCSNANLSNGATRSRFRQFYTILIEKFNTATRLSGLKVFSNIFFY